jgi:hypothetical protein
LKPASRKGVEFTRRSSYIKRQIRNKAIAVTATEAAMKFLRVKSMFEQNRNAPLNSQDIGAVL